MSYYNTNQLKGLDLFEAVQKGRTQEQIVLTILQKNPEGLTASQVWRLFPGDRTPLTSIRRALSDLKKAGKVRKTERMVRGYYGGPEHVWELINGDE